MTSFLASAARREAAGNANTALMHDERVRLQKLLLAAARQLALPYGSALQDAFLCEAERCGASTSTAAPTLVVLDEAVAGDDKFNPIVLEADEP